ncbi:MAG: PDZ domain-containing protein [Eudoraea sp.]|nr:PDZ domain-containing protein [Eudoraea sp.]
MTEQKSSSPVLIYLAGVVFIIWGILGLMDAKNYVDVGYQSGDNNDIVYIEEGSPADSAGMLMGDVIKSIGGIDANNNKELSKMERAKAGDVREYVVDRNGEDVTLSLTFTELNKKDKSLNMVAFIIGLLFILLGIWSHSRHKSVLSRAFAVFALCFGFIFMSGPYIAAGMLNNLVNSISTTIVIFSFAFLLSYLLKYPPESKQQKLLYLPAIIAALMVWVLNFVQPDGSGTINMVVRLFFGGVIILYFVSSLITLIRKYMRSSSEDRSKKGLNLMLIGAVIGLLPILVYFTAGYLSPGIDLPGNDYVFVTFVAIPIFFTMALGKVSRT